MKLPPVSLILLCLGAASPVLLRAGERSSATYSIVADTFDSGGKRASSGNYTSDQSVGGIGGVSTAAAPALTVKSGYTGQLYDLTTLNVTASPVVVPEGGTSQLSANVVMDDATTATVSTSAVVWNPVTSGVVTVNTAGLVTSTAAVAADKPGVVVRGTYQNKVGDVVLTISDTNKDNFGVYAADGLPDDWQASTFGTSNAQGVASADPDGDGANNQLEYVTGTSPTLGSDRFRVNISQPGKGTTPPSISFSPIVSGRTYTVEMSDTMSASTWTTAPSGTINDNGTLRTVPLTTNATADKKFFRVKVVKP